VCPGTILSYLKLLSTAEFGIMSVDVPTADRVLERPVVLLGYFERKEERINGKTQTANRTTQNKQYFWEECGPCPVFASYTLAFALRLRKKHGKASVRVGILGASTSWNPLGLCKPIMGLFYFLQWQERQCNFASL
jgi:hypothetical protein